MGRETWGGDGELRRACCWATRASRSRAASLRVLGELPPNSEVNLLPLDDDARRCWSRFSPRESEGEGLGMVVANELMLRVGMAKTTAAVVVVVVVGGGKRQVETRGLAGQRRSACVLRAAMGEVRCEGGQLEDVDALISCLSWAEPGPPDDRT